MEQNTQLPTLWSQRQWRTAFLSYPIHLGLALLVVWSVVHCSPEIPAHSARSGTDHNYIVSLTALFIIYIPPKQNILHNNKKVIVLKRIKQCTYYLSTYNLPLIYLKTSWADYFWGTTSFLLFLLHHFFYVYYYIRWLTVKF